MRDKFLTNEDLGIDAKGLHNKNLTPREALLISTLNERGLGRAKALSSDKLAESVFGPTDIETGKRDLRRLVNHLIASHKIPICSMAGLGGGYWMPESPEEVELVYQARRRRAMTGLIKMTRGRQAAYIDAIEQMLLFYDEPEATAAIERFKFEPEKESIPAWIGLTTRLLDKLSRDPQRYAAEIEQLRRQFGEVFVSRQVIGKLVKHIDELRAVAREIKGTV